MLTFKEAKRLSKLKWEHIYNNNGSDSTLHIFYPELRKLMYFCGFCEKYRQEAPFGNCTICPMQVFKKM